MEKPLHRRVQGFVLGAIAMGLMVVLWFGALDADRVDIEEASHAESS